ncbi:winged helix DNA-binding domain-containing protein [Dysgonomonas sp. 25]|uniref:winged helix DNA-binding domain-containing protein n=1 Tax=Dysgonomonas sp. 25 TaxID=2302933 RepID=UPI0013D4F417|nr:winged helix DNA-binding domain-containing protein [Dysgonomonas sp. 25]NDV69790.1 winged helix DNA-binding domain-containing protein [Dysgonomonas sp. 25]
MITKIRRLNQQLAQPRFTTPKDVVSWMGAIQAQEYNMAKWAVGIRCPSARIEDINRALEKGEIIRTHILRPTWHYVAAEDIRWMVMLSGKRIIAGIDSWWKERGKTQDFYPKYHRMLEKILEGKSLSKEEVAQEFVKAGVEADDRFTFRILTAGEAEGIVCSGGEKNKKHTYALLEERVPPTPQITKEEALAKLATKYFQSHSPATITDFIWWSGLSITEAKLATKLMEDKLITEKYNNQEYYIHESCARELSRDGSLHLLPSYDEYLISYKDRTAALKLEHHPKAFTNFGIFYPVIMHNGKIVGNWKKVKAKGKTAIETSFFDSQAKVNQKLIDKAKEQYLQFIS